MPKPGDNGYGAMDNYKRNNNGKNKSGNGVSDSIKNAKKKQTKKATREVLKNAAMAFNPAVGKAVDLALKTKAGDKLLDEFAKGKTPAEGAIRVANKLRKDATKRKILLTVLPPLLLILALVIVIPVIFKNADSQIFGNENGGDVEKISNNEEDNINDIFAKYPQLYETINQATYDSSKAYGVDVDRLLVISTLVAPLENGFFTPYSCVEGGEEQCTLYQGKEMKWEDFLVDWGYNAYLLSAMQMMTYVNGDDKEFCNPPVRGKMQAIADNDIEKDISCFGKSLFNKKGVDYSFFECVFGGGDSLVKAKKVAEKEVNANCTTANRADKKQDDYPKVRVLSIDEGEYEIIPKNGNDTSKSFDRASGANYSDYIVKEDPNTGGVYFWNLVNEKGFIFNYLTKYEIAEDNEDAEDDQGSKYEQSKVETYELARYIYDYYYSIRKDCRSLEIVPTPTESIETFTEYTPNIENQVFNLLQKYYDTSYKSENALEYYKALSIIIRSNLLQGDILPDADEHGITNEDQGLTKNDVEDTFDNSGIDFLDLINMIQGSYGTKGIVITEKNKEYKERIVKRVEIDEFSPQTYLPVELSLKALHNNKNDKLELGNNFFLDKLQRQLPVFADKIDFYIDKYDEKGYMKKGIDCPSFYLPENRPIIGTLTDSENGKMIRTCSELEEATNPENYKLYSITASNTVIPIQKVRGYCFTVNSCSDGSTGAFGGTYYRAEIEYNAGRKTEFPDYIESEETRGVSTVALRYFADQGYNWRGLLRLFLDRTDDYDGEEYHVTFKRIDKSLQEGECQNHGYTKESIIIKSEKCSDDNRCKIKHTKKYDKEW